MDEAVRRELHGRGELAAEAVVLREPCDNPRIPIVASRLSLADGGMPLSGGTMCVRVNCRKCGKPTWSGCGAHADTVLAGVPKEERCQCRADDSSRKVAKDSWLSLFSRALGAGPR